MYAVRVKPPPPLSHESINALKCNLVLVKAREDVYHLSGLHSLGLTKYQVRINLSDVMYFHVVENELIGVLCLSLLTVN